MQSRFAILFKPDVALAAGAVANAVILVAGWMPARLMVSAWQRKEARRDLGGALLASRYEYLGVGLPMQLTALAIVLCSLFTLVVLFRARRFGLVAAYIGYLVVLV